MGKNRKKYNNSNRPDDNSNRDHNGQRSASPTAASKNIVTSSYENGLHMDSLTGSQPKGTYPFGLNVISRDNIQNDFKSNEHSNKKLHSFESDIAGYVYQEEYNRTIYILEDQSIHIQEHDFDLSGSTKVYKVVSPEEFNCSWEKGKCEFLDIKVYTKSCDTFIQWSTDWTYYIVNITQMLDEKRKEALKKSILSDTCRDCNKDCNYFKVFKPKCAISSTANVHQKGGSLAAGAYVYIARLLNTDGNVTSWGSPTRPVYIYNDETNKPGEEANGRVELLFTDLDCNYNQIEIAVIYFTGSTTITRVIPSRYFSGKDFSYSHIQTDKGDPIDIIEVLSLSSINLEGRFQIDFNGYMYYYGIRPNREYNVQKISSDIETIFFTEKYSLEIAKKYQITTLPRGETVAFGFWINHDDGSKSLAGHIPCNKGTSIIPDGGGSDESAESLIPEITEVQEPSLVRDRDSNNREDTVSNPLNEDQLLDIEKQLIESYETDIDDIVNIIRPVLPADSEDPGCADCPDELNQFCNVKDGHKNADIINKDINTVEDIAVKWGSILSDLIGNNGKKDLIKSFSPTTIKEVALDIINSIKNREQKIIKAGKYKIKKISGLSTLSGITFTSGQITETEETPESQYPGGEFLNHYNPDCYEEKDTKYPCMVDCDGNPIFGDKAGQPVRHNKIPNENKIDYFYSDSVGVPSKITPDADEYKDGYVIVIGAQFSNINIDFEDYYKVTGKRVCKKSPFTIGQVKLTDANKSIITKGLATNTYISSNQDKKYVFQAPGVNSYERASAFIDIGDFNDRFDPEAPFHNSVCLYGLDQSALQPAVDYAETLNAYKRLGGIGYRHSLYTKGKDPFNKLNGRQVDMKGAVQSVNLSKRYSNDTSTTINDIMYVDSNSVIASPASGDFPLMNRYEQACLWINIENHINRSRRGSGKDKSFIGDVLDHEAPITFAEGLYVVVGKNRDNQYGAVENLSYIPKLKADFENQTIIKGLIGNRYISPYSFVKTSFISDRSGNKFEIGLLDPSKSDRCICDSPEDAITDIRGSWFWTSLPESGDTSDAKNWAGLHTPSFTRKWSQANQQVATESGMYYPGTVTTLITFWGEWETNPYGVEFSNELKKQRYPFIKPQFNLGINLFGKEGWKDSYLSGQHKIQIKQPSYAEKLFLVLAKSFIKLIIPILGIADLFSAESIQELAGDITKFPMLVAIWLLMNKVLFTNDFLNDFIGLSKCKTDEEGGIEYSITNFFTNWNNYSSVYNREFDLIQVQPVREMTNCCVDLSEYSNDIYRSSVQIESSPYNGFTHVASNDFYKFSQNKGKLTEIFQLNGTLYAHLTDAIYSIVIPQIKISTNVGEVIAGRGNIFNPQLIIGSNPEGYAGIVSRHHADNSQIGRIFVDYKASIIYHFTGSGGDLTPISFNSIYNFTKRYIKYCGTELDFCINEQVNSFYSLGYDPRLQRVLITKSDGEKSSWTISYDPLEKKWISFHSYIPTNYLTTRDSLYHLTKKDIYIHNPDIAESYGQFFEKSYPCIIDTVSIGNYMYYKSHIIDTEAIRLISANTHNQEIVRNLNITADKLGFYNSKQTSGLHDLDVKLVISKHKYNNSNNKDKTGLIDAYRKQNKWRVNELNDYTIDHSLPMTATNNPECNIIENTLTNYNYDNDIITNRAIQNAKDRNLADDWFITRLIFNNIRKDVKLYFKSLSLIVISKSE